MVEKIVDSILKRKHWCQYLLNQVLKLIIEQLNALDNPITIISNSNAYQHFAIKVQADIIPNCGPISGFTYRVINNKF